MRLGRYARGLPLPYEDNPKYIHYSILGAFYFFSLSPFIPFLPSSALLFQLSHVYLLRTTVFGYRVYLFVRFPPALFSYSILSV